MSNIICGIPQGSILGPLLFIIYVNDLCQTSEFLKPIMFADDANLFCKSKTVKTLFLKANIKLKTIFEWFQANKLSLNEDKTRYDNVKVKFLFSKYLVQKRSNLGKCHYLWVFGIQLSQLSYTIYEFEHLRKVIFLSLLLQKYIECCYQNCSTL